MVSSLNPNQQEVENIVSSLGLSVFTATTVGSSVFLILKCLTHLTPFCCSTVLWFYSSYTVLKFFGSTVLWSYCSTALWFCCSTVLLFYVSVVLCNSSTVVFSLLEKHVEPILLFFYIQFFVSIIRSRKGIAEKNSLIGSVALHLILAARRCEFISLDGHSMEYS